MFGPLARRHGAHVVAGSHLRLSPDGELTNASFLFAPDGRLLATTDKMNLSPGIEDGSPGALRLARGAAARVPIVDTHSALGRVATLIGYDACREPLGPGERWEQVGDRLAQRGGADVVATRARSPRADARRDARRARRRALRRDRAPRRARARPRVRRRERDPRGRPATGAVTTLARVADPARGGHVHAQTC